MLQVDKICDPGGLVSLEEEWWELWRRSPVATPFQSPAWLIAWWTAFAPGKLTTVAVRDQGRLVALAPLYLEDGSLGRRILPVGISLSDYVDILIDPDASDAGQAIVHHLSGNRQAWSAWEMTDLAPDAAALALPCPAQCSDEVRTSETCPVLHLGSDTADAGTHPAIPPRQRRKLRMARHRVEHSPGAAILSTAERTPREWMDALITLHASRWQERGAPGVLADTRVQSFHGQALAAMCAHGLARLFALTIGSDLAGIYYGFLHRDRAYAYLGGFDPRFAYYSPGTILIGHAIEDALRDGVREFHFLRGHEAYKYAWGAVDRHTLKRTFVREGGHARVS